MPRPIRILVLDDEPGLAESIAALLELDGHDVAVATTASEALELSVSPFHLLISDFIMPGMSGLELHERLTNAGHAPFWFVIMTGAPNSLERISHRAQRVLAKPVPAQALKDVAAECARAVGEIEHSCRRAR